jgi:hypothetical protein
MLALTGLIVCLVIAAALTWSIWAATRDSLRGLLDGVVNRSAATQFYLRAFFICITLAAFSGALGSRFDPSTGAAMERVWSAAGATSSMLGYVLLVLLAFAIILSILVAAAARRSAEPPVCLKCGYSLQGLLNQVRCPECGEKFGGDSETSRQEIG